MKKPLASCMSSAQRKFYLCDCIFISLLDHWRDEMHAFRKAEKGGVLSRIWQRLPQALHIGQLAWSESVGSADQSLVWLSR